VLTGLMRRVSGLSKLEQRFGKHVDLCADHFDQRSVGSWPEWVPQVKPLEGKVKSYPDLTINAGSIRKCRYCSQCRTRSSRCEYIATCSRYTISLHSRVILHICPHIVPQPYGLGSKHPVGQSGYHHQLSNIARTFYEDLHGHRKS
jgi:hypothetical protein